MSVSPFDHPWLSALLGDDEIARHFRPEAELSAMMIVETTLARVQSDLGIISADAGRAIAATLANFRPNPAELSAGTARDGVVVPEWVDQIRHIVGPLHAHDVHFGATSQDIIDTALILRLKPSVAALEARLAELDSRLSQLAHKIGAQPLQAYTRMQPAMQMTWADKIGAWRAPFLRHLDRLRELKPRLLVVQFGGPAGTLDKFGDRGSALVAAFAEALELGAPDAAWHSARDSIAELAGWLSLVTGSLGKIGQDVALLAQMGDVTMAGGGKSSAMPHKNNPVAAEVLVALARFNATQLSGMHHALVHEQERSGAAWTLEWMLLPQMVVATGAALARATSLLEPGSLSIRTTTQGRSDS
jgi:3-carboxy-cis,cis-muconate cycloisomerase